MACGPPPNQPPELNLVPLPSDEDLIGPAGAKIPNNFYLAREEYNPYTSGTVLANQRKRLFGKNFPVNLYYHPIDTDALDDNIRSKSPEHECEYRHWKARQAALACASQQANRQDMLPTAYKKAGGHYSLNKRGPSQLFVPGAMNTAHQSTQQVPGTAPAPPGSPPVDRSKRVNILKLALDRRLMMEAEAAASENVPQEVKPTTQDAPETAGDEGQAQ